ncbi:hypothetical protein RCL1_003134 [Eukaryota sp. TZLM3-RCL]
MSSHNLTESSPIAHEFISTSKRFFFSYIQAFKGQTQGSTFPGWSSTTNGIDISTPQKAGRRDSSSSNFRPQVRHEVPFQLPPSTPVISRIPSYYSHICTQIFNSFKSVLSVQIDSALEMGINTFKQFNYLKTSHSQLSETCQMAENDCFFQDCLNLAFDKLTRVSMNVVLCTKELEDLKEKQRVCNAQIQSIKNDCHNIEQSKSIKFQEFKKSLIEFYKQVHSQNAKDIAINSPIDLLAIRLFSSLFTISKSNEIETLFEFEICKKLLHKERKKISGHITSCEQSFLIEIPSFLRSAFICELEDIESNSQTTSGNLSELLQTSFYVLAWISNLIEFWELESQVDKFNNEINRLSNLVSEGQINNLNNELKDLQSKQLIVLSEYQNTVLKAQDWDDSLNDPRARHAVLENALKFIEKRAGNLCMVPPQSTVSEKLVEIFCSYVISFIVYSTQFAQNYKDSLGNQLWKLFLQKFQENFVSTDVTLLVLKSLGLELALNHDNLIDPDFIPEHSSLCCKFLSSFFNSTLSTPFSAFLFLCNEFNIFNNHCVEVFCIDPLFSFNTFPSENWPNFHVKYLTKHFNLTPNIHQQIRLLIDGSPTISQLIEIFSHQFLLSFHKLKGTDLGKRDDSSTYDLEGLKICRKFLHDFYNNTVDFSSGQIFGPTIHSKFSDSTSFKRSQSFFTLGKYFACLSSVALKFLSLNLISHVIPISTISSFFNGFLSKSFGIFGFDPTKLATLTQSVFSPILSYYCDHITSLFDHTTSPSVAIGYKKCFVFSTMITLLQQDQSNFPFLTYLFDPLEAPPLSIPVVPDIPSCSSTPSLNGLFSQFPLPSDVKKLPHYISESQWYRFSVLGAGDLYFSEILRQIFSGQWESFFVNNSALPCWSSSIPISPPSIFHKLLLLTTTEPGSLSELIVPCFSELFLLLPQSVHEQVSIGSKLRYISDCFNHFDLFPEHKRSFIHLNRKSALPQDTLIYPFFTHLCKSKNLTLNHFIIKSFDKCLLNKFSDLSVSDVLLLEFTSSLAFNEFMSCSPQFNCRLFITSPSPCALPGIDFSCIFTFPYAVKSCGRMDMTLVDMINDFTLFKPDNVSPLVFYCWSVLLSFIFKFTIHPLPVSTFLKFLLLSSTVPETPTRADIQSIINQCLAASTPDCLADIYFIIHTQAQLSDLSLNSIVTCTKQIHAYFQTKSKPDKDSHIPSQIWTQLISIFSQVANDHASCSNMLHSKCFYL